MVSLVPYLAPRTSQHIGKFFLGLIVANAKVVCSLVPEIAGNRDIVGVHAPQDLADVDFAIARAAFAVAETGSILLSDKELRVNAVAYLAQHLIVLLDPADIVVNLH